MFHNKNQILEIQVNIYITVKIGDLQIGTFYSIFPLNVRCKDKVETAQLYNEMLRLWQVQRSIQICSARHKELETWQSVKLHCVCIFLCEYATFN